MQFAVRNIDAAAPMHTGTREGDCVVCRSALQEADRVRRTACGHYFCAGCIERWLSGHAMCPLCNHDLTSEGGAVSLTNTTSPAEGMEEVIIAVLGGAFRQDASYNHAYSHDNHRAYRHPRDVSGGYADARSRLMASAVHRVGEIMSKARADVVAEVARALSLGEQYP